MRNTLQEQYNLIKEGKGAKDVFVKHAKSLFPHLIPNHYGFDNAAQILTQRNIISENLWGVVTDNSNAQPDWFKIFNESQETNVKADEKKPAKEVEKADEKSYSHQYEAKTGDDVIFDQYLNGIQVEACKSENNGKTVDELKKIVLKNLKKDNLYYTKNAAFGVEGIGYTDEAPGLGKTKEVKGKYASSGMEPVKLKENMNIKESSTLFRSPIELAKAVANKHGQELKQLKDQGYKVFEPAAIKYGGQTMKDSGMEMVVIKNLLYGYADEDWPSDYINELSNLLKNLNESQLRAAIRQLIKEELNLKEIDQVGEDASKEAKIKKINDEINKRKKKLKALETLKELEEDSVNPKKIKELYSEIKKLEGVSAKLSKKKGEKKEVIDETDTDPNRGTTVLPKSTPPADLKKLNAQGVDVELKELN